MNDGIDRDANGRIWLALSTEGRPVLTWLHANAWAKALVLRLPTKLLFSKPGRTGVLVLTPYGKTPSTRRCTRGRSSPRSLQRFLRPACTSQPRVRRSLAPAEGHRPPQVAAGACALIPDVA
jgi:hypothetical protein